MDPLQHLGQRYVEGQVEGEHHSSDERDEDGEGRVLEVGELHFHRAELGAPPDVRRV